MKVHELFTDSSKWTQGAFARDKFDVTWPAPESPSAVKWCLVGAIRKCYPDVDDCNQVIDKVAKVLGPFITVTTWNDAGSQTFNNVKALALKLDI